jgi:hypothetical protein
MKTHMRFVKNPWRLVLLPLIAAAALAVTGSATTAAPIPSAEQNTFIKWVTTAPSMAGVVGGAVGDGSYSGQILKRTPGDTTVIEALYHFSGSKHSFTALVHVEQTGPKAVIIGSVTDGWLKGNQVKGEYTQITSTQSPNGTAFQGTLNIMGAPRD